MNILIMGPAGAGKGTMSDLIIKEYDIPHFSSGDMLRENVRNNTELGQQAKEYMNSGKLVPDELINAMVEKRLLEPDCQKGYLLDGFPRTLVQAQAFEAMADRIGKPVESVLALEVGFDTLLTASPADVSVRSAVQSITCAINPAGQKASATSAAVNCSSARMILLNS